MKNCTTPPLELLRNINPFLHHYLSLTSRCYPASHTHKKIIIAAQRTICTKKNINHHPANHTKLIATWRTKKKNKNYSQLFNNQIKKYKKISKKCDEILKICES